MRAVLIIVDMLNDFFERSPILANERARLVTNTNLLIAAFRSAGLPVFWIRQEFAPDLHDAFQEMRTNNVSITIAGTPGCQLLSELDCLPDDCVIIKKRYSAFFGTDLDAHLVRLQPDFLVVAGVNTHACVRMTAVDAYQRDHKVVVAVDCVASHDTEHHDVTLRYLDGHICRVLPVHDILNLIECDSV